MDHLSQHTTEDLTTFYAWNITSDVIGKELVDFIADYLLNIRSRRVFPAVQPGYMRALIPDEAPKEGESFEEIFKDFESIILPGVRYYIV